MGGECTIQSELGKGTEISARIRFKLVEKEKEEREQELNIQMDFADKRILLVEDNAFNREIARYVLEGMGYQWKRLRTVPLLWI